MLRRKRRITRSDADGDELDRLLEREQQVASRLAVARAEAERLVREAREYASSTEASCESKIEERITHLRNSYDQQLQSDLQRIQSEAEAEARRFAEENPARTRALVALLLEGIGAVTRTGNGATG